MIDTDELDHIYPIPADLPRITERNLYAVWKTFSERGADRLILVGVHLDRPSELAWIARAIPDARFTLIRLIASEATLQDRVSSREVGSGMEAQMERTRRQLGRPAVAFDAAPRRNPAEIEQLAVQPPADVLALDPGA